MGDLLQVIDDNSVTFSANTPRADAWMRGQGHHGDAQFSYPANIDAIKQFKADAEAAGLVVSVP